MLATKFTEIESRINRKNVLGVVFGLGILVYQLSDRHNFHSTLSWILGAIAFASAMLLIARPQKNLYWLLASGALTFEVISLLPKINNHSVMFAAFGVSVLTSIIAHRLRRKPDKGDWFDSSEPFLRLVFLLGYGSAAIAKLNTDFFNPAVSCANDLAKDVYSWLPFLHPLFEGSWLAYVTAATELFVFFGLIFKRTRRVALVVASLFHLALSLNLVSAARAFNPALYTALMLFVPLKASDWMTTLGRSIAHRVRLSRNQILGLVLVFGIPFFILFYILPPIGDSQLIIRFIISITFSVVLASLIVFSAWKFKVLAEDLPLVRVPGATAWIVVGILLINSASPYLGGKTGGTFTMYSNLRVEGGVSNHFFIPRLPGPTPQDDLVQIIASTDGRLDHYAKVGEKLNWLSLQQIARTIPNKKVAYVRNGQPFLVENIGEDPELNNMHPIWGSLFWYRNVPDSRRCMW